MYNLISGVPDPRQGLRDRKIEFFLVKINGISQSLKTQEVIQDIASNARLIYAEGMLQSMTKSPIFSIIER